MLRFGVDASFWRDRSVFLTGHTGFKGGWLSLWLQSMGARVSGYALAPERRPCLFEEARVGDRMTSVFGDVRDGAGLSAAMAAGRPEIVFHLAAQPLVRASYADPPGTYEVNVMGTVRFLEAARRVPTVRAAVVVTSDKCYDDRELRRGYREDDPLGGLDPYATSKSCAELVTAAYRRSFFAAAAGPAVATVRAGNVIGGGDWADDRLIPDLVRAFGAGRPLRLRYPAAVRPWQFVLEPLRGYLMLAERLWHGRECSGAWNFGPFREDAATVMEVVGQASVLWGGSPQWTIDAAAHPHEASLLTLDCTGARERLGWQPLLSLQTALQWTIRWYRVHHEGKTDMRALTQTQIEQYEGVLATRDVEPPCAVRTEP